jgi:hypothetical protein
MRKRNVKVLSTAASRGRRCKAKCESIVNSSLEGRRCKAKCESIVKSSLEGRRYMRKRNAKASLTAASKAGAVCESEMRKHHKEQHQEQVLYTKAKCKQALNANAKSENINMSSLKSRRHMRKRKHHLEQPEEQALNAKAPYAKAPCAKALYAKAKCESIT